MIQRKWLVVGISIIAVVLLVLGSLSNVVGYQTVQTSQQNEIKERINQSELLFQTICDIANNKEIQRIIFKSQMSRGIVPPSEIPIVTKQQLRLIYFIGLVLSKVISKSKIQSLVGNYQFKNQDIQKEINAVIENDMTLNTDVTQLQNSECDCDNGINEERILWDFTDNPIICGFLFVLLISIATFFFPLNIIVDCLNDLGFILLAKFLLLITFPFMFPFEIVYIISTFLLMIFCLDIPTPKYNSIDFKYMVNQ